MHRHRLDVFVMQGLISPRQNVENCESIVIQVHLELSRHVMFTMFRHLQQVQHLFASWVQLMPWFLMPCRHGPLRAPGPTRLLWRQFGQSGRGRRSAARQNWDTQVCAADDRFGSSLGFPVPTAPWEMSMRHYNLIYIYIYCMLICFDIICIWSHWCLDMAH